MIIGIDKCLQYNTKMFMESEALTEDSSNSILFTSFDFWTLRDTDNTDIHLSEAEHHQPRNNGFAQKTVSFLCI